MLFVAEAGIDFFGQRTVSGVDLLIEMGEFAAGVAEEELALHPDCQPQDVQKEQGAIGGDGLPVLVEDQVAPRYEEAQFMRQPKAERKKDQSGNKTTLWTTVTLDDVSKNDLDVFLCEYSPDLFRMNNPPRRDIQEHRRYLKDLLRQRGGGPMGIELVKEIVIGTSDYEATVRLWQKLLGPDARASGGVWHPAAGPAIRFIPSASDGIQSILVRVEDIGRARRFLQASGLLGRDEKSRVAIGPKKVMGIDVQFVQ